MMQSRRPTRPVLLTPKAGVFRKSCGSQKHFVFQNSGNLLAQMTGNVSILENVVAICDRLHSDKKGLNIHV